MQDPDIILINLFWYHNAHSKSKYNSVDKVLRDITPT